MNNATRFYTTLVAEYRSVYGSNEIDFSSDALQRAKDDKSLLRALDEGAMPKADIDQIILWRTINQYLYKVRVAPSKHQINEAKKAFVERNEGCRTWTEHYARTGRGRGDFDFYPPGVNNPTDDVKFHYVLGIARQLCQRRVSSYRGPGKPSHGPGVAANSSRFVPNKFEVLERDVPYGLERFADYLVATPKLLEGFHPIRTKPYCKLSAVPKDARGPRLIAPHLVSQMWMQQAVADRLCGMLVRQDQWKKFHLPSGQRVSTIQFEDQSINASLALYASATLMYDTLDLSDASDRIPWGLVATLLRGTRLLRDLGSVRARYIVIDGREHRLHMHAPMGSACCFPVLSLVTWALVVATIMVEQRVQAGKIDFEMGVDATLRDGCCGYVNPGDVPEVYVFGDDVISPQGYLGAITKSLAMFNLKVNIGKSYGGPGGFRESCGCDAWKGAVITPIRLKAEGVSSVVGLCSLIAHRNLAHQRKYAKLVRELDLEIEIAADRLGVRHLIGAHVDPSYTTCLLFETMSEVRSWNRAGGVKCRRNKNLQRREMRVLQTVPNRVETREDLDSRSRLFLGVLGTPQRKGWAGDRPRTAVIWTDRKSVV